MYVGFLYTAWPKESRSSVYGNVQEGKVAIILDLHGESDIRVNVDAVQELIQLFWSMRPEDEYLFHLTEPVCGLVYALLSSISSKSSMKKLEITSDGGKPLATPSVFS
jgi:hypothetical protein